MALIQAKETRETGEPDAVKVARPVRRGAGRKGGLADLARGLPYLRCGFRQQLKPGVRLTKAGHYSIQGVVMKETKRNAVWHFAVFVALLWLLPSAQVA